ncbi:MAG: hypothetical protein JWQ71_3035 [Pedosphaera sp.]|nr:hypothetical protein [Pedosphaera sp.]
MSNNPPFNFGLGTITWNSWALDESKTPEEQLWHYGEGFLQVNYEKSNLTLHVEWRQDGENEPGKFVVQLIKNCDWEHPVMEEYCRTIPELYAIIEKFIAKANDLESAANK